MNIQSSGSPDPILSAPHQLAISTSGFSDHARLSPASVADKSAVEDMVFEVAKKAIPTFENLYCDRDLEELHFWEQYNEESGNESRLSFVSSDSENPIIEFVDSDDEFTEIESDLHESVHSPEERRSSAVSNSDRVEVLRYQDVKKEVTVKKVEGVFFRLFGRIKQLFQRAWQVIDLIIRGIAKSRFNPMGAESAHVKEND